MVWLIYFSSYGRLRLHFSSTYWLLPDDDSAELWSTRVAKAEIITAYTSTTACAYAAGRQELHSVVNCLNLGVEKDREGCEIWKQNKKNKKKGRQVISRWVRDSTRLSIGHRGKRPPRCSFLSISRKKKRRKNDEKIERWKKKRSWRDLNWNKTKTEIHEQWEIWEERWWREEGYTQKKNKPLRLREGYICSGAPTFLGIFLSLIPFFSLSYNHRPISQPFLSIFFIHFLYTLSIVHGNLWNTYAIYTWENAYSIELLSDGSHPATRSKIK